MENADIRRVGRQNENIKMMELSYTMTAETQTLFVMMGPEASISDNILHSKRDFVSNNSNIFNHQLD